MHSALSGFTRGVICLFSLTIFSLGQERPAPDLLLIHAHIVTMNSQQPSAQALAITSGKITWVGSDQDARKLFPSAKRTIDLHGATVLPGIIDAHTHLADLGKSLLRLNLKDASSDSEAVAWVRKKA